MSGVELVVMWMWNGLEIVDVVELRSCVRVTLAESTAKPSEAESRIIT